MVVMAVAVWCGVIVVRSGDERNRSGDECNGWDGVMHDDGFMVMRVMCIKG